MIFWPFFFFLIKQELATMPDNQPTQRKRILCGGGPWESPQGLWGARLGLILELHHKYVKSLPKFLSQALNDHRSLKPRFISILNDSHSLASLLIHVPRIDFLALLGYWQLEKAWATILLDRHCLCRAGSQLSQAASLTWRGLDEFTIQRVPLASLFLETGVCSRTAILTN